ncbi:translocation/assembly module TamB domain-containing protein [Kordiimonas aestuarii]|uniref:translocation/assembly module TamB domain-containing protein n=1 Tax=Kordiimonas aestuarii TaxID=1005925 RepID=UPI0021D02111|nr:translocation/assembly module TamB domain-containing protein [Kordiimonas aestuarii]
MSATPDIPDNPNRGWGRIIKRAAIALGVLVLLVVASGGTLFLWLGSEAGMAWLATRLSSDLDAEGLDIEVAGIDGELFSRFSVHGLTVADKEGVWLEAPQVTVGWLPGELLSRELHITALGGDVVTVKRLPKGADQQEQTDSGGLPVAIRVDSASLPAVYDGDRYTLALSDAAYDGTSLHGDAKLVNADQTDRVAATFEWADGADTFRAKADVRARAGGLITGLLGLGGGDSLAAQLDAEGTAGEWSGNLTASVPGKLALEGEGRGSLARSQIVLRQSRNAFVPAELQALLGGAANVELTIEGEAVDEMRVDLTLQADGVDLRLAGGAALEDGLTLTDSQVDLELARFSTDTILLEKVVLRGVLNLAGGQVDLSYNAQAERLVAADMPFTRIDATGTAAFSGGQLSGDVATLALTMTPPGLNETRISATDGRWAYDIDARAWRAAARAVQGQALTARAVVAEGDETGLKSAAGQADIPVAFLDRWHDGQLTGGKLRLDVTSAGRADGGARLKGTVTGQSVTYESTAVAELLGPKPKVEAGVLLASGGVTIERATLASSNLSLQTQGTVSGATLDLAFKGKVGALEKLVGDGAVLAGETVFSGTVAGDSAAPTVTFETGLAQIDAYGVLFADPAIRLALSKAPGGTGGLSGDVTFEARSPVGATTISSPVLIADGTVTLDAISMDAPGAQANGALSWSSEGGLSANLDARLQELKDDNLDLGGQGTISLAITMIGDELDADITLDMAEVRFAQPGRFPFTLEMAKGTAGFKKQAKNISYEADLIASNITYGAQKIDSLRLKGTSSDSSPLTAELQGYYGNRFELAASVRPKKGGADIGFNAAYGGTTAATRDPIIVRWGGEEDLLVEVPVMDMAGGTLDATFSATGENLNMTLNANGLALSAVNVVRPGSIETGRVDIAARFDRQDGGESGNVTIDFQKLTLPRWRLAAAPDEYAGSMQAVMKKGSIKFDGTITEAGKEFGRLTGDLPYERLEGQQGYAIREGAPLAMELVWQGDVSPIWLLARRPEHLLTGTLDGKLTLSGDLADPLFEGQLDLKDGHYEYEPLGLVAEIDVLRVSGTQDRIDLTELRANDGEEGKLSGEGEFELSSKLAFPGRLTAELTDFRVARLDELNGTASASLVYERTEDAATLSGQIKTGPMRVKMPKELPRSVVEIDVIEINGAEELEALSVQTEPQQDRPTNLSVSIEVPGRFFFEGRGLKSEWQGNLLLGGTSDDPELTGSMSVRDGSFSFGSKSFEITNGQLTFRGGNTIDPDISVTAVHTTPNLEAQLQISGPSSAPEFTLSSTPSLPEDEIMSRVLLGKSVSDLSAFQLAELVVAMDTLRGGGSFDVVGKLRRGLGLDTLSFGRTEDEDESATTITGGKYLRKNIYLEVETSTASSETATRLKIDISKNLLVETELGPRQGSSLRLKWFWEY